MHYTYKVMLHKAPECGFTASVPVLPGCITEGDTLDEVISRAKEAIELYIEELTSRGVEIPIDKKASDFFGTLSKEDGEKMQSYITQSRNEWELETIIEANTNKINSFFKDNNWTDKTIDNIANEHTRTQVKK